MSDDPPQTTDPADDLGESLYWLFASYIGGLIIEWGQLERAIDITIFAEFYDPKRRGTVKNVPGDFSKKINLITKIINEYDKTHQTGDWIEEVIPRIMEIKAIRDTLVHGYFGSITGSPPAIKLHRIRFKKIKETVHKISLSELEFQMIINDLRHINRRMSFMRLCVMGRAKGQAS